MDLATRMRPHEVDGLPHPRFPFDRLRACFAAIV